MNEWPVAQANRRGLNSWRRTAIYSIGRLAFSNRIIGMGRLNQNWRGRHLSCRIDSNLCVQREMPRCSSGENQFSPPGHKVTKNLKLFLCLRVFVVNAVAYVGDQV